MSKSTSVFSNTVPLLTLAVALSACNGATVSSPTVPEDGGHVVASGAGSRPSAAHGSSVGSTAPPVEGGQDAGSSGAPSSSSSGRAQSVSTSSGSSASSSGHGASSSASSGGHSESSSGSPAPSAYIGSTLATSPNDPSTLSCPYQSPGEPFLTIGTISAGIPTPVQQGTHIGGHLLELDCSVAASGGGFAVNVDVVEGGVGGISLFGNVTDTPGPQTGIQATFTRASHGSAVLFGSGPAASCSITLSPNGMPSISGGRLWGSLTCPMLTDTETQATCFGSAELLVENCSE